MRDGFPYIDIKALCTIAHSLRSSLRKDIYMKRFITRVKASTDIPYEDRRMYSLNDLAILLTQIEELKDYTISLGTDPEGYPLLIIGDSAYIMEDATK